MCSILNHQTCKSHVKANYRHHHHHMQIICLQKLICGSLLPNTTLSTTNWIANKYLEQKKLPCKSLVSDRHYSTVSFMIPLPQLSEYYLKNVTKIWGGCKSLLLSSTSSILQAVLMIQLMCWYLSGSTPWQLRINWTATDTALHYSYSDGKSSGEDTLLLLSAFNLVMIFEVFYYFIYPDYFHSWEQSGLYCLELRWIDAVKWNLSQSCK